MSNRLGFKIPGDDTRFNDAYVTWYAKFDGADAGTAGAIDHSPKKNGVMVLSNTFMDPGTGVGGSGRSLRFPGDALAYAPTQVENSFNLYNYDFTIDWWEYANTNTTNGPSFVWDTLSLVYCAMLVGWGTDDIYFYGSNDQATWNLAATVPMGKRQVGTWAHRAIVRKGPYYYTFQNGVMQAQAAVGGTGVIPNSTYGPCLGCWPRSDGYYYYSGYLDEFRVSKGIARWTANFTVPAAASPSVIYKPDADLQTVLVANADGFIHDYSPYRHGSDASPNVSMSMDKSKFGGASWAFSGVPSYVSFPASPDWNIGAGDFTIDGWVYLTGTPTSASPYVIVGRMQTAGDWNNRWGLYVRDDLMLVFEAFVGGSYTCVVGTNASKLTLNNWYHCAVVKHGNVMDIALNGIWGLSPFTLTGAVADYPSTKLFIGAYDANGTWNFKGCIDELRITKGRALWVPDPSNTPFTPPTTSYTNPDPTVILLHFDGDLADSSQYRKCSPALGGVPVTTTAQKKFGTHSFLADGANYMAYYPSWDWRLGSSDWTIDFWVYMTARQAADGVIAAHHQSNNTFNDRWSLRINPAGLLLFDVVIGAANQVAYPTATPVPLNAWTHCAVVCKNPNITFYINGVADGTTPITGGTIPSSGGYLYIPAYVDGTNKFVGYLDEFRLSKNLARWTANFTPPTGPA